jgi:hypothetical protein
LIEQMLGIVNSDAKERDHHMPNTTDTATVVQDKILASIQVSQKAIIDSVRSWAETIETVSATLPKADFTGPKPTDVLETTLEFNKKLLASQRDFATKVFEAVMPAMSATASATTAAKPRS